MVRLAYTLLASSTEAEEVVQDSFIEVYRRWDDVRKPGAYLRCAVVSRCRSALQRRKIHPQHPLEEPSVSTSAGELWDVLTRLSDEQRLAVVLRYYGGYPASEIATMLDMPAATVRSHLRRGLATLKRELSA
jgi:RNA polymerase sigma factor (sigma-70 family)